MAVRSQAWLPPSIVEVVALRAPLAGGLRRSVQPLLDRGARQIVLDLSRVEAIDAAGVGELTGVFNAVHAAGGALRICHLRPRVHHILAIVGLLGVLTPEADGGPGTLEEF